MGPYQVALELINSAIKELFLSYFEDPDKTIKADEKDPYGKVRAWFSGGNTVDLLNDDSESVYKAKLDAVEGLHDLALSVATKQEQYFFKELILHGLATMDVIGKNVLDGKMSFSDPLAKMFDDLDDE